MPAARRVSQRRVVVRRPDARFAGAYHRAAGWWRTSAYDEVVASMPVGWRLECSGRVTQTRSFGYARLVELAHCDRSLGVGITLVDFLAGVGLRSDAEVLLAHDSAGRTFGVPVRDVVADDAARLTLGTRHAPLEPGDGFPVRLDVPGWTDPSNPVVVTSLEAISFSEFVRCP